VSAVLAASARVEIGNFVAALFNVYMIILIAWIVVQLVLSLGARVPYNRVVHGVLDFLRDTADPYLRIFRRLPLQVGPLDLSPIVAIFVLRIVGFAIIVPLIRGY
jgi:YggT family protein